MNESENIRQKMNKYLRLNFYRTEGYINRLDAVIFREIIAGQIAHEVHGALAEIGVHYGRSFFLLATGRARTEKSLAIDLFEDDELNTHGQIIGRNGGFHRNCHKYHVSVSPDEILKGSSLEITAEDIIQRVGPVRFFSVDGGHMYRHVANDLSLAEHVLVRGGVICADDIFTPLWPEVGMATFDWLRKLHGRFAPFLSTPGKLYVCDREYIEFYHRLIGQDRWLSSRTVRTISVLGHPVKVLFPSPTSKLAEHAVAGALSVTRRLGALARPRPKLQPAAPST
jgi:hypothetical protein